MNKRNIFLFIIIGIIIVLAALFLVLYFFGVFGRSPAQQASNTQQSTSTFPASKNSTTTTGIMTVKESQSGSTLLVKDFIHNGQTTEDAHDQGTYVLASNSGYCIPGDNCPVGAASTSAYDISYQASYDYFNILLLQEPLGESRDEAEQFLENALGLSAGQICSLNYSVGTILSVNAQYAGDELGFSNCPGAVELPQ